MGQDFRHGGHDCVNNPAPLGSHVSFSKQPNQASQPLPNITVHILHCAVSMYKP